MSPHSTPFPHRTHSSWLTQGSSYLCSFLHSYSQLPLGRCFPPFFQSAHFDRPLYQLSQNLRFSKIKNLATWLSPDLLQCNVLRTVGLYLLLLRNAVCLCFSTQFCRLYYSCHLYPIWKMVVQLGSFIESQWAYPFCRIWILCFHKGFSSLPSLVNRLLQFSSEIVYPHLTDTRLPQLSACLSPYGFPQDFIFLASQLLG